MIDTVNKIDANGRGPRIFVTTTLGGVIEDDAKATGDVRDSTQAAHGHTGTGIRATIRDRTQKRESRPTVVPEKSSKRARRTITNGGRHANNVVCRA